MSSTSRWGLPLDSHGAEEGDHVELIHILCLGLKSPGLTPKDPKSELSIEVNRLLAENGDAKGKLLDPVHSASRPCRLREETMADASAAKTRFDVEAPESGFVTNLGGLFPHQADHAHELVSERAYHERVASLGVSGESAPQELGLEGWIGIGGACESKRVCLVGMTA
jgi:hypothetical protein